MFQNGIHSVKISSRGYSPEREAWMVFPGKNSIREVWKECIFHVEKWPCSYIDDLGPVGWAEEDHIKVCFLGLINQCKFDLKNSKWREKWPLTPGSVPLRSWSNRMSPWMSEILNVDVVSVHHPFTGSGTEHGVQQGNPRASQLLCPQFSPPWTEKPFLVLNYSFSLQMQCGLDSHPCLPHR